VYQIDMKVDRQLHPAAATSSVVSHGGKTIPRWRTAAILKIDISPYCSEQELSYRYRSRVSCAHNMPRASVITPWPRNLG